MHDAIAWIMGRLHALRQFSQEGAAAVEYGLLVALIAVAIIAAVATLGGKVSCSFTNTSAALSTPTQTATNC